MTRFRKTTGQSGRVVFVGAGPGDPGMLTARATAALAEAALVLVDPDVSLAVQDAVREARPDTELSPAVGEPAEVAKSAVEAAKKGAVVVRLVAGDPYTSDAVVKEVLAVGRTSVPFDVVPGVATATAVPAYAGVALGSTAVTADLRSGVDLTALAGAASAGGTLVLQSTAEELPDAAAHLVEGGLSGRRSALPHQRWCPASILRPLTPPDGGDRAAVSPLPLSSHSAGPHGVIPGAVGARHRASGTEPAASANPDPASGGTGWR